MGKWEWSELLKKEDWWAVWLGFFLLVAGMFISTVGTSMIWPFMTIYVSERLNLPLTEVAGIITALERPGRVVVAA